MEGPSTTAPSVQDLVFSDLVRYRPSVRPSWVAVLISLPAHPGLLATLFLRAQQGLVRSERLKLAWVLRSVGNSLVGADFIPGCQMGPGVMFTHPVGCVIGSGARVGANATFASGVVLGVKTFDYRDPESADGKFPTVGEGAFLGAHAVLVGGVKLGDNVAVGANAVVTRDVPSESIVAGNPAVIVGVRAQSGPPR